MKELLEKLYPINACLLGEGYDKRLAILREHLKLETICVPSGMQFGTWTVPDEWIVRDAWVKYNGEKIIDYKEQPLSLVVGSLPFHGKLSKEELEKKLYYTDDRPDAVPYVFKFYDKDWGFCVRKNQIKAKLVQPDCESCDPELRAFDPELGSVKVEGDEKEEASKVVDRLEEGEYEVFIDTEYRPGIMAVGVHTIPGKSDREILLFAHLDHPYQANDNLSGVLCLLDLAKRLKVEHTIKIIFCPETIGSIVYASYEDLSKVDFTIAVDICGNDNSILFQKSFDDENRLNRVAHCCLQMASQPYRKGRFRNVIGSDEYYFNDPKIGIPGVLISRHPYAQYHTSEDTPETVDYDKITETADFIIKLIETYEKDYVPIRTWTGPLMRSRFGLQSPSPQINLNYDYLFYSMDGKKSLAELCAMFELNFDQIYEALTKLEDEGFLLRADPREGTKRTTAEEKLAPLSRKADVPRQRRKKS